VAVLYYYMITCPFQNILWSHDLITWYGYLIPMLFISCPCCMIWCWRSNVQICRKLFPFWGSHNKRAIWTTSTVQNRTQLLRGILPKVCPFSRPSLSMWQTYTDMRTCYPIMPYLWKILHCPMQSVTNAVPPWPPWHQRWHRSYDILPQKLWGLHKEWLVPSITIYTPHVSWLGKTSKSLFIFLFFSFSFSLDLQLQGGAWESIMWLCHNVTFGVMDGHRWSCHKSQSQGVTWLE